MKMLILFLCFSCTMEMKRTTQKREHEISVDSNFTGELFGCLGYVKRTKLEINFDRWDKCCKKLQLAWYDHVNSSEYGREMWREACFPGGWVGCYEQWKLTEDIKNKEKK